MRAWFVLLFAQHQRESKAQIRGKGQHSSGVNADELATVRAEKQQLQEGHAELQRRLRHMQQREAEARDALRCGVKVACRKRWFRRRVVLGFCSRCVWRVGTACCCVVVRDVDDSAPHVMFESVAGEFWSLEQG